MPTRMQKVIPVICNANQARSVVAVSFLQVLHPSLNFKSYGVNAISSTKIPQSTKDILNKWQLPLLNSKSLNVREDLLKLQQSDVILAADSKVARSLIDIGFSGSIIQIVDQVDLPKELIPIDPLGLSEEKFELELAKFVFSASMLFSQIKAKKSGFSTHVPWTDFQLKSVQDYFERITQRGINLVVDATACGLATVSKNVRQELSATTEVKPQQIMKQLSKVCLNPSSPIYYLRVKSASFRDLIRLRDKISTIRELGSAQEIKLSLITQPLYGDHEMQVQTLLSASVSNGQVKFWMPKTQQGKNFASVGSVFSATD